MSTKINKGDHVRFMSMTGGGVVVGFAPNNVVLVKDDSGFELPVLRNEVVVVSPGSTIAPRPSIDQALKPSQSRLGSMDLPEEMAPATPTAEPEDLRIRPKRAGGEKLTALVAFLPDDVNKLGDSEYEAYLVNDSNYDLYVSYALEDRETGLRELIFSDWVAFDSVSFIERFSPDELSAHRRIAVQIIPAKRDESYRGKPGIDAVLKVDPSRFFRKHAFVDNDFFDEEAILFTLIDQDDTPSHPQIDPAELRQKMLSKQESESKNQKQKPQNKAAKSEALVIDLHHHSLLDDTRGLEPKDILLYQLETVRKTLKEQAQQYGKKIILIHGKGEGVLRNEVRKLVSREFPCCTMQDASFQEYGFGATQVVVHQHPQHEKKTRGSRQRR